jgi:hypothetical protein
MIFQDLRWVPVSVFMVKMAASEPLKRVTRRILELVSIFVEASKKFKMKYHNSKLFQNFENHQGTYKKF